jgi:UDPglucose 6-dehydrogenase
MRGVEFAASELEAARDADAVVLVTEWPQFLALDWSEVAGVMAGDVVIDGRNALDPAAVRGAGLRYEGVGRGGDRAEAPEPAEPAVVAAQPASGS